MRSIRRTLMATLLAAVTAVTLAAALFTYRMARQQMDAIFDYHLRQLALSLRSPPAAVQGTPSATPDAVTTRAVTLADLKAGSMAITCGTPSWRTCTTARETQPRRKGIVTGRWQLRRPLRCGNCCRGG